MVWRIACLASLAACSKAYEPPRAKPSRRDTESVQARAPGDASDRIDHISDHPDRHATGAQRESLPPGAYAVSSAGFLRITKGDKSIVEGLPPSPRGAGEFPMGCWAAPDGSVYVVGKQYTGVPGPDDGAVYTSDPR
jgi:hypothetical protein